MGEENIFIADVIQHMGRRTSTTTWDDESIIYIVESLKPNFGGGEQILVYSEEHRAYKLIDEDMYSDALVSVGQRQADTDAERGE